MQTLKMVLQQLLLAFLMVTTVSSAWGEAAQVAAESGKVTATGVNGVSRTLAVGDTVEAGETVVTQPQAWVVLRMIDGASLSLRPDSKLTITDYTYDENKEDDSKAFVNLLKGALRSISGLIAKHNASRYELHTPTATLGIRGTDHETVVVDEQQASPSMPAGTYESVNDGKTVLRGEHGEIPIEPGKVGYLHPGGQHAPSLLAAKPKFFQRIQQFDQSKGINRVLGNLHQHLGNGVFGAHPDLKERLRREWPRAPQAQAGAAGRSALPNRASAQNRPGVRNQLGTQARPGILSRRDVQNRAGIPSRQNAENQVNPQIRPGIQTRQELQSRGGGLPRQSAATQFGQQAKREPPQAHKRANEKEEKKK